MSTRRLILPLLLTELLLIAALLLLPHAAPEAVATTLVVPSVFRIEASSEPISPGGYVFAVPDLTGQVAIHARFDYSWMLSSTLYQTRSLSAPEDLAHLLTLVSDFSYTGETLSPSESSLVCDRKLHISLITRLNQSETDSPYQTEAYQTVSFTLYASGYVFFYGFPYACRIEPSAYDAMKALWDRAEPVTNGVDDGIPVFPPYPEETL